MRSNSTKATCVLVVMLLTVPSVMTGVQLGVLILVATFAQVLSETPSGDLQGFTLR